MKFQIIALSLTLVGSCATLSYKEKIENFRNSIVFEDISAIEQFSNTITAEELKTHVYGFSSDTFKGRRTGEIGHHKASSFLKNYYISEQIASPLGGQNYFRSIPSPFFPKAQKPHKMLLPISKAAKCQRKS